MADSTVTLKLSHSLTAEHAALLGADERDYDTNDPITVRSRDEARALIASGYAQVDPEDRDAVRKALGLKPREARKATAATTAAQPSSRSHANTELTDPAQSEDDSKSSRRR